MKAVILCDGEAPAQSLFQQDYAESRLLIAADGGAYHAEKLHVTPDIIIGDMDSYRISGREPSDIIHDKDQETNDLEKALAYASKKDVTDVVVFGATGERLDHTLKNLSVMKQFDSVFRTIRFRDNYSDIFLIHSPFKKTLPLHTSISLYPLSGVVKRVRTQGLKYSLDNQDLENGIQDGSSNLTIENQIEIEFDKGDLLFFINHKPS